MPNHFICSERRPDGEDQCSVADTAADLVSCFRETLLRRAEEEGLCYLPHYRDLLPPSAVPPCGSRERAMAGFTAVAMVINEAIFAQKTCVGTCKETYYDVQKMPEPALKAGQGQMHRCCWLYFILLRLLLLLLQPVLSLLLRSCCCCCFCS